MPPDPHVHAGVSAWVERDNGDVLMLRRAGTGEFGSNGNGQLGLPGGWLDFGESPTIAAVRETLEETGIVVHALEELHANTFMSQNGKFWVIDVPVRCFYRHNEPAKNMEPEKCSWVGWMSPEDLRRHYFDGQLFRPLELLVEKRFHLNSGF